MELALERIAIGSVAMTARALVLSGVDLSFTQWRVLAIAGERPDGVGVSEIAARLGAELSPASRLIGRLARRGYVELGKDQRDRRITRVTLTEAGGLLRNSVFERRRLLLSSVVAAVGKGDPDHEAALDQIAAAFSLFA